MDVCTDISRGRHIKKEEEEEEGEEITISLIVFERRLRPRSVESLQ